MKPLLTKTTKPFLLFVLIILLISIPVYYLVIEKIWINELDDQNRMLAETTATEFNKLHLTNTEQEDRINFWNKLQPGLIIEEIPPGKTVKDSVFTADKKSPFLPPNVDDNYRVLITTIKINNKSYYFRSITSFEDTRETVTALALVTLLFFVFILLGILLLNRNLSRKIWSPFHQSLNQLKNFNLNQQKPIQFQTSDVKEFEELNNSLNTLIDHTLTVYKSQKEFTENASHELQTPLAILKNKVDLLLQSDDLTEKQYDIAEEMNRALIRSAQINKNLLLLAKIENSQFANSEIIRFDELLQQSLENLQEHFQHKNISTTREIAHNIVLKGNESLTEILINNLLLNAIRHTLEGGFIGITLTPTFFEVANSGTEKLDETLLFKRFAKLSHSNKGSGLGLPIVKEICKSQNWQVAYRFEDGLHRFSIIF